MRRIWIICKICCPRRPLCNKTVMEDDVGQDFLLWTFLLQSTGLGKLASICQAPALIFTFLDVRSRSTKQMTLTSTFLVFGQ